MQENTTLIPANALRAALLCAGDKDVRYYLNGIYIDRTTGHLVSTDGSRMLVYQLAADAWVSGPSFIVPRETIKATLALNKGADFIPIIDATPDPRPDPDRQGVTIVGAMSLNVDGIKCAPIDGKFPEWRRVSPSKVSGEYATLDPELVLDAHKALAILAGRPKLIRHDAACHFNGTGPAVFMRDNIPAFVLVMPIRGTEPFQDFDSLMAGILKSAEPVKEEAA